MKFMDFLIWHQQMIDLPYDGNETEHQCFLREINICIDAYVEAEQASQITARKFTSKINELCQLRDSIVRRKDAKS